jgi:hypothetical protein
MSTVGMALRRGLDAGSSALPDRRFAEHAVEEMLRAPHVRAALARENPPLDQVAIDLAQSVVGGAQQVASPRVFENCHRSPFH